MLVCKSARSFYSLSSDSNVLVHIFDTDDFSWDILKVQDIEKAVRAGVQIEGVSINEQMNDIFLPCKSFTGDFEARGLFYHTIHQDGIRDKVVIIYKDNLYVIENERNVWINDNRIYLGYTTKGSKYLSKFNYRVALLDNDKILIDCGIYVVIDTLTNNVYRLATKAQGLGYIEGVYIRCGEVPRRFTSKQYYMRVASLDSESKAMMGLTEGEYSVRLGKQSAKKTASMFREMYNG